MGPDGVERRKSVRVKFPCKIFLYTPENRIISTHTENISVSGMRIIIEEELPVSSVLDLEIILNDEPIACKGEVVWVVKKKSRCQQGVFYFDMGIHFSEIRDADQEKIKNLIESTD